MILPFVRPVPEPAPMPLLLAIPYAYWWVSLSMAAVMIEAMQRSMGVKK